MLPYVKLRDLQISDVEDRYKWSLDAEVSKYLAFPDKYPPFTKQETHDWIKLCIEGTNGYFQKSIITENDVHIGWVDLKHFDNENQNAELGITIGDKSYCGKGYGASAILAMLRIGFGELKLHKIWLRVDYDNEKAISSYRKIGFKEEGILREDRFRRGKFIDRLRFSIINSEMDMG